MVGHSGKRPDGAKLPVALAASGSLFKKPAGKAHEKVKAEAYQAYVRV